MGWCDTEEVLHDVLPRALKQETDPEPIRIAARRYSIHWPLILVSLFSVVYFTDTYLRASEKYFWYDELFTVYTCRLPDLHAIWDALRDGLDFNPPLFFLITKASQAVFGAGLIGTRMPEILAFWVCSVCLFRFVNHRAGPAAGFVAMAFPMLTGAYYYAYEARPHALVLGFCALALICWQNYSDPPKKLIWLAGLSSCLAAALLVHCYAAVIVIPFVLVELFRTVQSRRFDWAMWVALALPGFALLSYFPLLSAYKVTTNGTEFFDIFPPVWVQFRYFYIFLLGPAIMIVLFTMIGVAD